MAELEIMSVTNPTDEEFVQNYNGEPYTIGPKETKQFVKRVALHIAKHLSTKIILEDAKSKLTKEQKKNRHDPAHVRISQLGVFDTPERRVAIYKILGSSEGLLEVLKAYPWKGSVGDMSVWDEFLKKEQEKSKPSVEDKPKTEKEEVTAK